MMTDEQFDALWQRAESQPHARRLSAQYPAWRARRRRNAGIALMSVALLAVVVPLVGQHASRHDDYAKVYCNRTGTDDQQWADLAATLLLES